MSASAQENELRACIADLENEAFSSQRESTRLSALLERHGEHWARSQSLAEGVGNHVLSLEEKVHASGTLIGCLWRCVVMCVIWVGVCRGVEGIVCIENNQVLTSTYDVSNQTTNYVSEQVCCCGDTRQRI